MKKLLIVIVKSLTLAAENGCMASCSIAKRHDSYQSHLQPEM